MDPILRQRLELRNVFNFLAQAKTHAKANALWTNNVEHQQMWNTITVHINNAMENIEKTTAFLFTSKL